MRGQSTLATASHEASPHRLSQGRSPGHHTQNLIWANPKQTLLPRKQRTPRSHLYKACWQALDAFMNLLAIWSGDFSKCWFDFAHGGAQDYRTGGEGEGGEGRQETRGFKYNVCLGITQRWRTTARTMSQHTTILQSPLIGDSGFSRRKGLRMG